MKILFIAPLPPPVSGNSLAAKVLLEELIKQHEVEIIDLKKESLKNGIFSFSRIIGIISILKKVYIKRTNTDRVYFTISQSLLGNIRDIIIYLLCFKKLHKMVIHLHGGSIKSLIFDKYKLIYIINRFFIRRLGGVIVLGCSHVSIFDAMIPRNKIHIVPNFAEDYLFNSIEVVNEKFKQLNPLNILYLSNMVKGKGYNELIDAYISLDDTLKTQIRIDFAGTFETTVDRSEFLKKIDGLSNVKYHGFVAGKEKKELLTKAQIFCLPTYYHHEGQPISILEAYASGCVVVTTDHSGIKDVFLSEINGFQVEKKSHSSLRSVLEKIIQNSGSLAAIGLFNRNQAHEKFRTSIYNSSLSKIITGQIK